MKSNDNTIIKNKVLSDKYFGIAYQAMLKSTHRTRVGAVLIVSSKNYVSTCNKNGKTHPLLLQYPNFVRCMHAELSVILKCKILYGDNKKLFKKSKLYIYREDKYGLVKNSKPCVGCQFFIAQNGIKTVYYTTNNGFAVMYL